MHAEKEQFDDRIVFHVTASAVDRYLHATDSEVLNSHKLTTVVFWNEMFPSCSNRATILHKFFSASMHFMH